MNRIAKNIHLLQLLIYNIIYPYKNIYLYICFSLFLALQSDLCTCIYMSYHYTNDIFYANLNEKYQNEQNEKEERNKSTMLVHIKLNAIN